MPDGEIEKVYTEIEFENFWILLSDKLNTRKEIINWTAHSGEIGENFEARFGSMDKVLVYIHGKREPVSIDKSDFKFVYDKWNNYMDEISERSYFHKIRTSKFVISIIHQYLKK